MAEKQIMTEQQARKLYSGFIPPGIQIDKGEPTPADIEAARALLAKVEGKKARQ